MQSLHHVAHHIAHRRVEYKPCWAYPQTTQLILQCIKQHANRAGVWQQTNRAIAAELQLALSTVNRGIAALRAGGQLRVRRHGRQPSTYRLPRAGGQP